MNALFVCDNEGEYFLIRKKSPNWVLKAMAFNNQAEIVDFCKKTGADLFGKQIPGYYVMIVFMNDISLLDKEEFKFYRKAFPITYIPLFLELYKNFTEGYFLRNKSKFNAYRIKDAKAKVKRL